MTEPCERHTLERGLNPASGRPGRGSAAALCARPTTAPRKPPPAGNTKNTTHDKIFLLAYFGAPKHGVLPSELLRNKLPFDNISKCIFFLIFLFNDTVWRRSKDEYRKCRIRVCQMSRKRTKR